MGPLDTTARCMRNSGMLRGLFFIFFALVTCPVSGQGKQKRPVSEADYHLWHSMTLDKLSGDGNWISYKLGYENTDTLCMRNTATGKTLGIPNGSGGKFSGDCFAAKDAGSTLHWYNLKTGVKKLFANTKSFDMAGNYVVALGKGESGNFTIYGDNGNALSEIKGVTQFTVNPDKASVAVSTAAANEYAVKIIQLAQPGEAIIVHGNGKDPYSQLSWSEDGKILVFSSGRERHAQLYCYRPDANGLKTSVDLMPGNFEKQVLFDTGAKLSVAADGTRVFFITRKADEKLPNNEEVQVWNAADRWIYPKEQITRNWTDTPMLSCWEPQSGRVLAIADTILAVAAAVGNKSIALSFNPKRHEPQEKSIADLDYWLTDLETGKREMLLEKQNGVPHYTMASPEGKYIAYFRDMDWYAYETKTKKHIQMKLPEGIEVASKAEMGEGYNPYRSPAWTPGDKSMLIYDEFDIWEAFPDGTTPQKLTRGREQRIVFRIAPLTRRQQMTADNGINTAGLIDLDKPVLLSAQSTNFEKTGYYRWSRAKGLQMLGFDEMKTSQPMQSSNGEVTVWLAENFETPPHIVMQRGKEKPKVIFRSNKQKARYFWGSKRIFTYKNTIGIELSGILYYPAGFEKGNKYPMVVHIYERQLKLRNIYTNPTMRNGNGFNISNLTAQGYFVFLPDIVSAYRDVGEAALDCVESGVGEVLKMGLVDEKRIGLLGHSFGGYETDYIICKSGMFACAISGAAMTNFISATHALDPNANTPNFFKIENGQARARGSFFENREYYIRNSPLFYADGVTTPLLSWTGGKDSQVLPTQTIEFYMALRRLRKTHIMLIYPDEIHEIMEAKNTSDLTRKTEQWLAHYLKNAPKQTWMFPN